MTAYDDLSPRARWYLENFSELDLAEICASLETSRDAAVSTLNDIREIAGTGYERGSHPERMGYLAAMGRVIAVATGQAKLGDWTRPATPADGSAR